MDYCIQFTNSLPLLGTNQIPDLNDWNITDKNEVSLLVNKGQLWFYILIFLQLIWEHGRALTTMAAMRLAFPSKFKTLECKGKVKFYSIFLPPSYDANK